MSNVIKSLRYRPDSNKFHELLFPWMTRCGLVVIDGDGASEVMREPNCSKCKSVHQVDFSVNFENGFGAIITCFNRELIDGVRKGANKYVFLSFPYGYKIEIFYPLRVQDNVTIISHFDSDDDVLKFIEKTVVALSNDFSDRRKRYSMTEFKRAQA